MFRKCTKIFRSRCKNYKKINFFSKKKSPKPSSGFAECSFVTPWRNFWPKNQKDGQNMEEVGKPWYSQNYFFSIFFPRHVNCGFENPIVNCLLTAMNSPPLKTKILRSGHKIYKKTIVFKKVFQQKPPLDT